MKLHSLYPAVDLSFASQQFSRHGDVSTSVVDVQIRAVFFPETVPADTQAYAVVISDKLLTCQSEGSKMSETTLKLQGAVAHFYHHQHHFI